MSELIAKGNEPLIICFVFKIGWRMLKAANSR